MIPHEPPRVDFHPLFALACAFSGILIGLPIGFGACLFFFPS